MVDQIINHTSQEVIEKIDGIEILVEWAKSGKIDPWNIDLVHITDMFLEKLVEIKQHNLRLTGRTLFFAAVLLKLKSDFLEGIDPFKITTADFQEFEEPDFSEELSEDYNNFEDIRQTNTLSLESAIVRRTSVRKNRTRSVTLEDLIKELRKLEEIENIRNRKAAEERVKARRSYTHFTPEDILDMAHDEQIDDEVAKLQTMLSQLFESEEKVELNELLQAGMDKATAYIALLHLASQSPIELVQEHFYSDLYIVKEVS